MNNIILILTIFFTYLILSSISNPILENFESLANLSSQIGENTSDISNIKNTLNKTLDRAKDLKAKLDGIKKQSGFNEASGKHASVQSLNISPKSNDDCESFTTMTQDQYQSLNEKNLSNQTSLGALKSIISQINDEIKSIKNNL